MEATHSIKFRTFFAFLVSLTTALLYIIFASLKFSSDKLFNQYYYVVPIIIPFVLFLIERIEKFNERGLTPKIIDAIVILTAMWRVIGDVPYVSGHALFLTYAGLSGYSLFGRISALIVLLEVIYLKVFVWNDWITLTNGAILGIIAFLIAKQFRTNS